MALSIINGTGDGTTTTFAISFTLGFISRADVTFYVDGEVDGLGAQLYRAITWINDGLISIAAPVTLGATYHIARTVDKTELAHDYADGEPIKEVNLDDSFKQTLMAVHEFLDGRLTNPLNNNLDMGSHKIVNLADGVGANDAVNKGQLTALTADVLAVEPAAAASATAAAASAVSAATSAATATTKAAAATTSASGAATSATNAATSATNAATSASGASTSATTATTQASAASASATAAAGSATTASTQATNAAASATSASGSATTATTQATAASGSATAAASSATTASTQATNASASATSASGSATTATTQATTATTQATNASTSATNAATSATNAATSATLAAAASPGFVYTYDSTTTASDPGAGKLRFNNATLASATALYISETTGLTQAIAAELLTWAASTSTVHSKIRVSKNSDHSVYALFNVTGTLTDNGAWDTLTVAYVSGSGSLANNDAVTIVPLITGDKGTTGTTGATGPAGGNNGQLVRTSSSVVTLMPKDGNVMTFPDGTTYTLSSSGVASGNISGGVHVNGVAAQTLSATTLYYVYLVYNAGTPFLDFSATGHSTDATSGFEIKTGDATRLLVGMVYPQAGPVFTDSTAARLVASYFKRQWKAFSNSFSTDRTSTATSVTEINSEIRGLFLTWGDIIDASYNGSANNSSGSGSSIYRTAIGVDGVSTILAAVTAIESSGTAPGNNVCLSAYSSSVAEGQHYITLGGNVTTATTGTWKSVDSSLQGSVLI